LAKNIHLEKPWLSPDAKRLDSMTLATFLDRQVWTKAARSVLDAAMETLFAAPAAEISLLHALFYAKSGNSLETLINIDNGAQQDRIKGGAQGPADRLAARFAQQIHFNRELKAVIQDENGVTLVHQNGQERADRVIIAIPPTLAGRIDYSPALPARRDQLTQRVPMGTVIKCYAIYPQPWWRKQGMSGQVVADEDFPIQTFFDNSPSDGSKGVLMGFSLANRARPLLDKSMAERGEMVRKMLIRCFGPAAGQWEQYFDHSWADETYSRGCYAAVMPPGAWTGFEAALSEPCGRIYWAGTETSPIWNGYIEGAIRSGERAAAEVLGLG
jgi:monoamine oxidase